MSGRLRRLVVGLVVFGLVAQSAVAPAMAAGSTGAASLSATSSPDPCNPGLLDTAGLYNLLGIKTDECADKQAQEMVTNTTWADFYASGLALNDHMESSRVVAENHVEDSKTYARTIVKTEAVQAFNNGSSESEINTIVNDSVEDYYATMERNLLTTVSSINNQLYYQAQASHDVGSNRAIVIHPQMATSPTHPDGTYDYTVTNISRATTADPYLSSEVTAFNGIETINTTYSLVNGKEYNFTVLGNYDSGEGGWAWTSDPTGTVTGNYGPHDVSFWVQDPNNPGDGTSSPDVTTLTQDNVVKTYDRGKFDNSLQKIKVASQNVKVEGEQFVDLLFANYNQSEGVPIQDVLNPNDLTSQWNTDYNTTGYYGWIASTLGLTGLEGNINSSFKISYTPSVNHTDTGEVSINGSGTHDYAFVAGSSYNLSGTLMTDWDPTGPGDSVAFERGKTYDTSNATAPVLFVEQVNDTESRVIHLEGTFTVTELTDVRTGDTINATDLEEQNQQTWNESSSVEEISSLADYRESVISNYDTTSSGGSSVDVGSSGLLDGLLDTLRNWFDTAVTGAWLGLIALAGVGLLMLRILSG